MSDARGDRDRRPFAVAAGIGAGLRARLNGRGEVG
jgi:hypothetical protein